MGVSPLEPVRWRLAPCSRHLTSTPDRDALWSTAPGQHRRERRPPDQPKEPNPDEPGPKQPTGSRQHNGTKGTQPAAGEQAQPRRTRPAMKRNRRPANELGPDGPGPENPPAAGNARRPTDEPGPKNQPPAGERTQPRRTRSEGTNRRPATQPDRRTNPTRSTPAPCPQPALRSVWPVKGRRPRISRRPPDPLTSRADRGNDHKKGAGTTNPNRPEQPDNQRDWTAGKVETIWTAGRAATN
jgi:hypothetical protein